MPLVGAAQSGLGAVQNGRGYLDTLANRFVVKPRSVRGLGGFVFSYEGESSVVMANDITDHFVENNTAIQDHAAQKPVRLSLRGFVGEVVVEKPAGLAGALQFLQNGLSIVPAYLGKYTPQALTKVQGVLSKSQSLVNKVDNYLARAKNVVDFFDKAADRRTKQEKAFAQLRALAAPDPLSLSPDFIGPRQAMTFDVETPWGVIESMAIESVSLIQDDSTRSWSDVAITLKQVRFAEVPESTADKENMAGRAALQRQGLADKGKTKGKSMAATGADALVDGIKGRK